MGQITIDTSVLLKWIGILAVTILVLVLIVSCVHTWEVNDENAAYQAGLKAGVASVPTPVPTIALAQVSQYPENIAVQIDYTSTAGGDLTAVTYDGRILLFSNLNLWESIWGNSWYYVTVIGIDPQDRYITISAESITSPGYSYTIWHTRPVKPSGQFYYDGTAHLIG